MRNRTWTDVILALTIALCVATVAAERRAPAAAETGTSTSAATANVADGARAVAAAVLWGDSDLNAGEQVVAAVAQPSPAERALNDAAQAAGAAASELEMPFFSFGSAAAEQ